MPTWVGSIGKRNGLGVQVSLYLCDCVLQPLWDSNRPVALMARASDSKSGGWGFESLLACIEFLNGFKWVLNGE